MNAWKKVEGVLLSHYHSPDLEAARVLYSAFAAHRLSGAAVWPMIVAPPGSMKTDMLNVLEGQRDTHFIDQITPNTFISGQIERPGSASKVPPGLLHRIGNTGVIVFSDFSTVLAMPPEKRALILADMRRIYDGGLRKEYGSAPTRGPREWKGRITFVVAATDAVDRAYSIFQTLGERFIMVRCPRADGTAAALAAMRQNRANAINELKTAVQELLAAVPPRLEPALSNTIAKRIAALAEFVVCGRTHIERDGREKEIRYEPQPESPTRLSQQLSQLAKGSALLDGRAGVNAQDYRLAQRVGLDCIPATRRKLLEYLSTGDESKVAKMPASTRCYAEEELQSLGLVSGRGSSAGLSTVALSLISDAELF